MPHPHRPALWQAAGRKPHPNQAQQGAHRYRHWPHWNRNSSAGYEQQNASENEKQVFCDIQGTRQKLPIISKSTLCFVLLA